MRTKLLLTAFAILTVFGMRSQDTIPDPEGDLEWETRDFTPDTRAISFPFWMVREIALDLEERSLLELQVELLETATCRLLVQGLEKEQENKQLQLELLQKNQLLLHTRLKLAGIPKAGGNTWKWMVRMTAALGIGYMLGNLNH